MGRQVILWLAIAFFVTGTGTLAMAGDQRSNFIKAVRSSKIGKIIVDKELILGYVI